MSSRITAALQAAILVLFTSLASAAPAPQITHIDPPRPLDQIDPMKINNAGSVVGIWFDSSTRQQRGFYSLNNLLLPIDYLPSQQNTVAWAINDHGVVTGNAATIGFIYDKGKFTAIHKPGSGATSPNGINNNGVITGLYSDPLFHGFLLKDGVYTTLDVPNSAGTIPWDINDHGDVVGEFGEPLPSTVTHGFVWVNGVFTTLHVPGSTRTRAWGLNNLGQVVGEFHDTAGKVHGFAYWKGRYASIEVPGGQFTVVKDINDWGDITGTYFDPAANVGHGFTANVYELKDSIQLLPP